MKSILPESLRREATATEELHPEDSEIAVMREAADEIERLEAENTVFGEHCAAMNNLHRHRFDEAVTAAVDKFFKAATWPREALKAMAETQTGNQESASDNREEDM